MSTQMASDESSPPPISDESSPLPNSDESSPPPNSDEFLEKLRIEDPDADVILCSCDHQEFRVLKLYIIKVSPVLRDLIQSASSSHDANTTTSLPSIQLSDTGVTLSSLLTFVLPVPPVIPSTIEETMTLLSAAQKYQMDLVLSHIRTVVESRIRRSSVQRPHFEFTLLRRHTDFARKHFRRHAPH